LKIIFKKNKGLSQIEFKTLFDNNFDKIRNYVYFKCGNIEQAEDIAQEAFLKLWEKRTDVKKETMLSYLYRIAHNVFINQAKREQLSFNFQNSSQDCDVNMESPEYVMELKEFDEKLQNALAKLSEKNRVPFLMNRVEGMKYREIAESLGISVKAVEKRMQNALSQLRDSIEFKL